MNMVTKTAGATTAAGLLAATIALAVAVPAQAATGGTARTTATVAAQQPLLREGSQGAAVSDWQSTLNKLVAKGTPTQPKVAVDGIFGPATKAATQAFQRWAHISADGIVGVQTYTAASQALG
jgi:zinc D-Ala-D-Ala carboxypeptidase